LAVDVFVTTWLETTVEEGFGCEVRDSREVVMIVTVTELQEPETGAAGACDVCVFIVAVPDPI